MNGQIQVRVGVGVLILNQGKVLLGKRHAEYSNSATKLADSGGTWTCPGGSIDFGETLIDCAKREVLEEVGLVIHDPQLISISDNLSEQAQYVTVGFLAESFEGILENKEPEKIDMWNWFDIENLPENLFGPSKKIITSYLEKEIYCL